MPIVRVNSQNRTMISTAANNGPSCKAVFKALALPLSPWQERKTVA